MMAMATSNSALPAETLAQIEVILKTSFNDGRHWVKGIGKEDWRRVRYFGDSHSARRAALTGPSGKHIPSDIQALLGYIRKNATTQTALTHIYMVVRAEKKCLDGNGIALLRPVLKTNIDHEWIFRFMRGQYSGAWEANVPGHGRPRFRIMGGQCSGLVEVVHPCGFPAGFPWLNRDFSCNKFASYSVCILNKGSASV